MNRYETVFIMTPVLSDDQATETVDKFRKFLKRKRRYHQARGKLGLEKVGLPNPEKNNRILPLVGVRSCWRCDQSV